MAEHKLALKKRELTGKMLKSLRKEGFIPSVVYGNKEPKLFSSEYVATEKVLEKAGYHSPIDLDLEGKKQMAIVKDIQIDPVSRMIVNVEFQAISAREVVEAMTPITIVNFEESEASKTYHFMMTQAIEEIAIKAKPADLPNGLEIDASGLENVEDKLTIKDIKLPEGVEFSDKELDLEQVVVSLYDPVAEAEKREAEAEAEAEVEGSETAEEEAETKNAEAETSGETEEKTEEASEE